MRSVAIILLFLSVAVAAAQTPEKVVQKFVEALNRKDIEAASKLIKDGSAASFTSRDLASQDGWPTITISNVTSAIAGDHAIVSFHFEAVRKSSKSSADEFVVLVRSGDDWLIDVPERKEGLAFLAFLLSDSPMFQRARAAAKDAACVSNLKQLAIGAIMLTADNDDVFKMTAANWRQQLEPYTKNKQLFTCPLDPEGTISYSFNEKLANKSAEAIEDPAGTVMMYEGKAGQLNFRHNGRAAVAFCDGHVKLLTKEEAQRLKWK